MSKMKNKKQKRYYVYFHVLAEQSIEIVASSKKEAKEKAMTRNGEPINFVVLHNLWSTTKVNEWEEK